MENNLAMVVGFLASAGILLILTVEFTKLVRWIAGYREE